MNNFVRRCGKKCLAYMTMLSLLTSFPAYAAPPNTGAVLEGAKPPAVTQPPVAKGPVITVEGRELAAQSDDQQKVPVKGFRIGGEPPLPTDELLGLVKNDTDRDITLGELNDSAGKITQYLRQKGYLVAFAYIPSQTIVDGIVEIDVVPGKYGQVKINGNGHFDHERLKAMLHAAAPGTVITRLPLERALLLLSDLNGISIKATLSPGATAGTADLLLDVADAAKWKGTAYTDNWGNHYTSQNRLGVQLTEGNISGEGDDLSLGGLISQGSLMTNYNLGYSTLLGNDGMRVSVKNSRVDYTLGDTYVALGATGQATVTSGDISYPLIRSRAFSLYGTVGYDDKRLRDDQTATDTYMLKKSHLFNIGVSGNFADNWLGGGTNAFSLINSQGRLNILDAATVSTDSATANTAGDFTKTLFTFQRQQYVTGSLTFYLNFTGQMADKNLDSSEKLFLGGADGVRAFPQGEAPGDEGYKLTGELRWRLSGLSRDKNNLYLAGFYDYGSIIVNHTPWAGAGDNRRSLMGAGLGLLWTHSPGYSIRLDYAWKIGQEQATADTDKNGRLWLQGVYYF